jgi:hypothetical protein
MSQDLSYTNFSSERLPASRPQVHLRAAQMPTIVSQSPLHTDKSRPELSPHPYAYGAISHSTNTPLSASPDTPPVPRPRPQSGFLKGLKSSISTPNLRHNPFGPKARERWFAAQTWCDAFFFPRPRFQVHTPNTGEHPDKGKLPMRMMSPAESPPDPGEEATKERSVYLESQHKLQSTANFPQSSKFAHSKDVLAFSARISGPSQNHNLNAGARRYDSALDDLALPSPAPSLPRQVVSASIKLNISAHETAIESLLKEKSYNLIARHGSVKPLTLSKIKEVARYLAYVQSHFLNNQSHHPIPTNIHPWSSWRPVHF